MEAATRRPPQQNVLLAFLWRLVKPPVSLQAWPARYIWQITSARTLSSRHPHHHKHDLHLVVTNRPKNNSTVLITKPSLASSDCRCRRCRHAKLVTSNNWLHTHNSTRPRAVICSSWGLVQLRYKTRVCNDTGHSLRSCPVSLQTARFVTNLHSTHDYKLLALGLVLLFIGKPNLLFPASPDVTYEGPRMCGLAEKRSQKKRLQNPKARASKA